MTSGGGELAAAERRPMLRDVNAFVVCGLCDGYLVDATTLTHCMHSFCRSCLLQYLRQCKVCPTCRDQFKTRIVTKFRRDRRLQTLVYKLVPGLYADEVKRRTTFCTEGCRDDTGDNWRRQSKRRRLSCDKMMAGIYKGDEQISVCLQHCDIDRLPSLSLVGPQSSYTSVNQEESGDKRFLLCPVNITVGLLKKYVHQKFSLEQDHHRIEMFVGNERLPDSFTLMDVAYSYFSKKVPRMTFHYVVGSFVGNPQVTSPAITSLTAVQTPLTPQSRRKRDHFMSTRQWSTEQTSPSRSRTSRTGRRRTSMAQSRVASISPISIDRTTADLFPPTANEHELLIETDHDDNDGIMSECSEQNCSELQDILTTKAANNEPLNSLLQHDSKDAFDSLSSSGNKSNYDVEKRCTDGGLSSAKSRLPMGDERMLSSFLDINLHEMMSSSTVNLSHLVDDSSCELNRNDLYNNNSVSSVQWLQKACINPSSSDIAVPSASEIGSVKAAIINAGEMSDASSDIDVEIRNIVANVTINSNHDDTRSSDDCEDDDACCGPAISSPYRPESETVDCVQPVAIGTSLNETDCTIIDAVGTTAILGNQSAAFPVNNQPPIANLGCFDEGSAMRPIQQQLPLFDGQMSNYACTEFPVVHGSGSIFNNIVQGTTDLGGSGELAYLWNSCSASSIMPGSQVFYMEAPSPLVNLNCSVNCSTSNEDSVSPVLPIQQTNTNVTCSSACVQNNEIQDGTDCDAVVKLSSTNNQLPVTSGCKMLHTESVKLSVTSSVHNTDKSSTVQGGIITDINEDSVDIVIDSRSNSPSVILVEDVAFSAPLATLSTSNIVSVNSVATSSSPDAHTSSASFCTNENEFTAKLQSPSSCVSGSIISTTVLDAPVISSFSTSGCISRLLTTSTSNQLNFDQSACADRSNCKVTARPTNAESDLAQMPCNELLAEQNTASPAKSSQAKVCKNIIAIPNGEPLPSPTAAESVPASPASSESSTTATLLTEKASVGTQTNDLLIDKYFRRRTSAVNSFLGGKYPRGIGGGISNGTLKDRLNRKVQRTTAQPPSFSHTAYTFSTAASSSATHPTTNAVLFTPGQGAPMIMPAVTPLTINGKSTFIITLPANFTLPTTVGASTVICPSSSPSVISLPKVSGPTSVPLLMRPNSTVCASSSLNGSRSSVMLSQTYGTPIQLVVASANSGSSVIPCITLTNNRAQVKTNPVRHSLPLSEQAVRNINASNSGQDGRVLTSSSSNCVNGIGSVSVHCTSSSNLPVMSSSVDTRSAVVSQPSSMVTRLLLSTSKSNVKCCSASTATITSSHSAATTVLLLPISVSSSGSSQVQPCVSASISTSSLSTACIVSPSSVAHSNHTIPVTSYQEASKPPTNGARHLTIASLPQVAALQRKSSDHVLVNSMNRVSSNGSLGPSNVSTLSPVASPAISNTGISSRLPPLLSDQPKQPISGEGAPVRLIRAILERSLTGPHSLYGDDKTEKEFINTNHNGCSSVNDSNIRSNSFVSSTSKLNHNMIDVVMDSIHSVPCTAETTLTNGYKSVSPTNQIMTTNQQTSSLASHLMAPRGLSVVSTRSSTHLRSLPVTVAEQTVKLNMAPNTIPSRLLSSHSFPVSASATAARCRAATSPAVSANVPVTNGSKRRRVTVDVSSPCTMSGLQSTAGRSTANSSGRPKTVATMLLARNNSKQQTCIVAPVEPKLPDVVEKSSLASLGNNITLGRESPEEMLSRKSSKGSSQEGTSPTRVKSPNIIQRSPTQGPEINQQMSPSCTVATALVGRATLQSAARSTGSVALPKKLYAYLGSAMSHEHIAAARESAAANGNSVITVPVSPVTPGGAEGGLSRRASEDSMADQDSLEGQCRRQSASDDGPIRQLRMMCSGLTYNNVELPTPL